MSGHTSLATATPVNFFLDKHSILWYKGGMSVEYHMYRCFDEDDAASYMTDAAEKGWQLHSWHPTTCPGNEGAPSHTLHLLFYRAPVMGAQEGDSEAAEAMPLKG